MQRLLFRLGLCALATLSSSSGAVAVTRPASLAADARVVPVPGLPEVAEGTPQIDLFLSGTTDLSTDGCGSGGLSEARGIAGTEITSLRAGVGETSILA